ncbi:MAG: NAD-glutamate dehydrogenase domain-containing protein [bacterium]
MASINLSKQTHLDEDKDYSESFQNVLQKIRNKVNESEFPQYAYLLDKIHDSNESELIEKIPPGDVFDYLKFLRDQIQTFTATSENQISCTDSPIEDAGQFPYAIVNAVVPDYPFVVDSFIEWISNEDFEIEHTIYSSVDTETFPYSSGESPGPFFLSIWVQAPESSSLPDLESELITIFEDIELSVTDFESMTGKLRDRKTLLDNDVYYSEESTYDIGTVRSFFDYLLEDNFVFLGYGYNKQTNGQGISEPMGLLRREDFRTLEKLPLKQSSDSDSTSSKSIFSFNKTNILSRVYRRDRLYCLTVNDYNKDGELVGQDLFLGLFTNRVMTEPSVQIPVLQQKFEKLTARQGLAEHTHDYRDVYSIYNSMPKHLLFMTPLEELIEDIQTIIDVKGERTFKVRARPVPHHEGLTMMIMMEKEKFSGEIRKQIQEELKQEFEADHIDYRLSLGEGAMARLYFDIETERMNPKSGSFEELEEKLHGYTRTWSDRLREQIFSQESDKTKRQRYLSYLDTFSENYRALVSPEIALQDIRNLESLRHRRETTPLIDLVNADGDATHLMIYHDEKYSLNQTMPILSNHGFTVVQQATFEIDAGESSYHLHLFDVLGPDNKPLDLSNCKKELTRSISRILDGNYRDDSLNELILRKNLPTQVLNVFRLYKNYFHQLSPAIKLESINRTLLEYSDLAKEFHDLFKLKFDPSQTVENRQGTVEERCRELENRLQDIEGRTPYQILRSMLNLIESTVRTNYFQEPGDTPDPEASDEYISIKIDCESVDQMPEPRPLYEIFVYSPLMEALHLRSGKIARGGIRWSDRRDDFRTEILGLMKTQKVKNALIVPEGAKGGFVLKTEYLDPGKPLEKHAREQYAVFMHAMLDLTDNYVEGELTTPPNLVTYDGEDPYHVVAADKGTATFSDTANRVADKYDFWLGDAFASGGSVGYDHKELGITAKGGWECVKRHFRELGKNIQEETFTVVGIGDMSGDVFGNGMILSDNIKLNAAFNHRNIFLDPDPDPAASFEERKRLFEMEGSTWEDYDESIMSDGGGVYSRSANLLELSEEARDCLDLDSREITPDDLIKAILCADVDLLWNGGIGTYIKSSKESHADVGDPQNDAFRADADEVRASVIGEGGNLGITQNGRIELDRHGIKLNTDFIDNSGGVDLSDHEVNLKILFKESIKQNILDPDKRESLLNSLSDEVMTDVIHDNYEQSAVISLESVHSADRMEDYRHLIQHLEETINLDRSVESLPDEQELQDRQRANESMTRPELAVLLSYTKMDLYNKTRQQSWPESTVIEPFLRRYFPPKVIQDHSSALDNHRLRKEIALTSLVNYCVDGAGCIFFHRLEEELGVSLIRLTKSYLTADRLSNGESLRNKIFELDNKVSTTAQYDAWQRIVDNSAHTISWLIDTVGVSVISPGFQEQMKNDLDNHFETILETLQPRQESFLNQNVKRWEERNFSRDLSQQLGKLPYLVPALEILLINQDLDDIDIRKLSDLYFRLGQTLHVDWVIRRIFEEAPESRWDQFAFRTLGIELHDLQRQLLQRLLERDQSLDAFKEENRDTLNRLDDVQQTLANEETKRYSAYQYMAQRMRSLL